MNADNMYPAASMSDKSEGKPEGESEDTTALLPKSLFGGECKVGDIYKIKVVAIHEDELEVEPAGEEKSEDSEMESDDMENPVSKMMRERG